MPTPRAEAQLKLRFTNPAIRRLAATQPAIFRALARFAVAGLVCASPLLATCGTTTMSSTDTATTIQNRIDACPSGTTFLFGSGTYRLDTKLHPSADNQTFAGAGAGSTFLSGAKDLSGLTWTSDGSGHWYVTGQTQSDSSSGSISCQSGTACKYPFELFLNNNRKTRVIGSLPSTGQWELDDAADRIYVGDNPSGQSVETSVTDYAFDATTTRTGIVIENFTFEKYANPTSTGAINGGQNSASGWIVSLNTITNNHAYGYRCSNSDEFVNNVVRYNGQLGIGCSGHDVLVDNNEIAHNNDAHYDFSGATGEGGGTKFSQSSTGLVISNNYVHDNDGPGIWLDGSNQYWTVQSNRTYNNKTAGILDEISFDGIIRYNVVDSETTLQPGGTSFYYGSAIHVSNSYNAEIYGNYVVDSSNGIGGSETADSGVCSPHITGLNVHDNTTSMTGSGYVAGAVSGCPSSTYAAGSSNVFTSNTYRLPASGTIPTFVWCSGGSSCTTYVDTLSYSTWHDTNTYKMDSGGDLKASTTALTSADFAVGDHVITKASPVDLYSLPTTASPSYVVATLSASQCGTITNIRGPIFTNVAGVVHTWWQVTFTGPKTGWLDRKDTPLTLTADFTASGCTP